MYLLEFRQDVRYAVRLLAKSPGFSSVAVLSLAIGIGLCSTVLTEIQAIVGPPPGVRDPASLVTFIWGTVSYPYFERYRDESRTFAAAMAVLGPVPVAVASSGNRNTQAERFYAHLVSPEYFSTLSVVPAAGRFFSCETEKPGMPPVVVVSHWFWRSRLHSDPNAVGILLRLNSRPATIVGIAPEAFHGVWPGYPVDLFVPATCGPGLAPEFNDDPLHNAGREIFRVVFRLAPGVTMREAEASLNGITANIDRDIGPPARQGAKRTLLRLMPAGTRMYITPEQHAFVNTFNVALWGLVLSLVCANLANLMLARGDERKREIAVRLSIGAGRLRLIRQFLTESMLLAFAGGLAGIALAFGLTRVISTMPATSPTTLQADFWPNLRVMMITLAVALLAGVGFGLAPALSAARIDIGRTLKGAQTALRGYHRFSSRNVFVVCQTAASLMLLLVTWFVAMGFLNTSRLDVGFDTGSLYLISLDPVRDGYSGVDTSAIFASLPQELARVNGVAGVSVTGRVPFAGLGAAVAGAQVAAETGERRAAQRLRGVFRSDIGAHYFSTLGIPLLGGREFNERDQNEGGLRTQDLATPAILNQTAARELFGAQDPMGRRIRDKERSYTVVGLVRDVPSGFLRTKPVPTLFLPLTHDWFRANLAESVTILLRAEAGADVVAAVRKQVALLHPGLTIFDVRTLREDLERLNAFVERQAAVYVILGLFALMLASIGLAGVTAYAVARRRKEIGIRMALGARRRQVLVLVLKEGAALVTVGTALGLCGAFVLARAFAAYSDTLARTFSPNSNTRWLVFGAPPVLAGLALLACYLPARRATAIDPMTALRDE